MQNFINAVGSVVWGIPMLVFFLFTSLRFTLKCGFYQFTGAKKIIKSTLGSMFKEKSDGGISQFSAFCSVLGACIGTGNIVGVATAVYSGGAGTVFWMIISAVFSMATAYAENYLGVSYRKKDRYGVTVGGAFSYIENGLKMKGLAKVFAFFCLMSSIGMGNMTQSNSIADSLKSSFNISPAITGTVVAFLCFLIISGGVNRIAKVQTVTVPLMSAFYFIISGAVIYKFKRNIIPCISKIIKEAFSLKAVGGFGIYKAARYGISRGVFSNEAGLGSSTILHSAAENQDSEAQGSWAMLEVFIDTVLMCSVTAIVLLLSTNCNENGLYGAELSVNAYSSIGEIGKKGIGILTAIFAFSSLASCSFYGEKSFEYLFGKKHIKYYKICYVILALVGSVNSAQTVWTFADICNGLMAIPNLFALNCLANEVHFPKRKSKKRTYSETFRKNPLNAQIRDSAI